MTQARKILLAGMGDELRLSLESALKRRPDVEVEEAPSAEPSALNGKVVACDALIVEVDVRSIESTERFARLAAAAGDGKVIAATRVADPEAVRRLFRAGAADVLTAPFAPDAFESALHDILQAAGPDPGRRGEVITVLRASGGAGATTVALNLAALLGRPERKGAPRRTSTMLDLDLQFGDADLALDLEPRSTVVDVLRAEQRFDGRLLQSAMVDHNSGLRLLASPPDVVPLDALSPAFAARIVAQSAQLHDFTVVDLPVAWTDWTIQILRDSSRLVLVAPPTVQGAIGVKRILDGLEAAAIETPALFVMNKLANMVDAFEKPSRIAKSLNRPVDAVLSLDASAARAFDRGVLLVDAFPNARLARELRGLAAKVAQPAFHSSSSHKHTQPEAMGAAA
ncbi:CpaE family protein [Phenylobacterium sp.]|jgi:pilus assembly protein CpaE|uniref:CpaE family protein n=1 Tax=Phenylobacterium sp. TaxID=1871053 RepID=UPI0037844345